MSQDLLEKWPSGRVALGKTVQETEEWLDILEELDVSRQAITRSYARGTVRNGLHAIHAN